MRAVRWHARGDVRLDEVAEPVAGPGEALIDVALCGICGSDLAEYRDGPQMIQLRPHPLSGVTPPLTLGHEFVGTVVSGNSLDGSTAVGARVTVDACLRCGRCPACVRGDYHRCRYGGSIGLHADGGFARLVKVPCETLVDVPDGVRDEQAALTEPFAVALHALDRAGLRAGDRALVLGFGPIGAASALVARALGAAAFVVELAAARRSAAERLGFTTLDAGDDLPRRVRHAVGGGGVEVVVESTGAATVAPLAVECATRGGRIVLVGLPKAASELDMRRLTLFERSLVGSLGYRHDLPRVLALVSAGAFDPAVLVGDTVALADVPATIATLAAATDARIKVLVDARS